MAARVLQDFYKLQLFYFSFIAVVLTAYLLVDLTGINIIQ